MPRSLHAYYYDFEPTGIDAIDAILEAVAKAGKAFHHTDGWNELVAPENLSPKDWIENAAAHAALQLTEAELVILGEMTAREYWDKYGAQK